jgi:hypothetical protein
LLDKLDVTDQASEADIKKGIALLIEEPSGNFRVDEPFLQRLFSVTANRAQRSPERTGQLMAETPFPLEGMIVSQPTAASSVLSSDLDLALGLIKDSDPVLAPPWRILYQLMHVDAPLAAVLVVALDRRGEGLLVTETLAYFAYDEARSAKFPELAVSVAQNAAFLESLLEQQGADWVQARLNQSVELYRSRSAREEVAPDFLERYRETLDAAAQLLDGDARDELEGAIRRAFG